MSEFIVNSFQIPNAFVDVLMRNLSGNAVKCYLLISRKTTGWQKQSDKISLPQFMEYCGIKKRDTAITILAELEKANLIISVKRAGSANEYFLNKSPATSPDKQDYPIERTSPDKRDYPINGTSPDKRDGLPPQPVPINGTTTSPDHRDPQNTILNKYKYIYITPLPPKSENDVVADADASVVANTTTSGREARAENKKTNRVPVQSVFDAYNEVLGGGALPMAQVLNDSRKRAIARQWKQMLNSKDPNGKVRFSDDQTGIAWFKKFFSKVQLNKHWIGENDRGWRADLDWIFKPTNFIKILEWRPKP